MTRICGMLSQRRLDGCVRECERIVAEEESEAGAAM